VNAPQHQPQASESEAPTDIVEACDLLQREMDALLGGSDGQSAVQSLDGAVASLKEVEQRNVSSVQLVALS
jgi:hypothetical protein